MPGPHQVARQSSRARTRSRAASWSTPGTVTDVTSSRRRRRARCSASALVGLDPVTTGPLQLARRRNLTPHTSRHQRAVQPEPRRPRFIRDRDRPGKASHPPQDVLVVRGQPRLEHLTSHAIDRRRDDRSCVHIQSHTRTLREHRGLPHMSDRPSRRPLLGNPRICVSEAPARNHPATPSSHSIPSSGPAERTLGAPSSHARGLDPAGTPMGGAVQDAFVRPRCRRATDPPIFRCRRPSGGRLSTSP